MAFTYLEKPAGEQDPVLRSIAKTIIADQQFENGYMVGLLLDMGADPANETGQAMAWMDQPVPLERMPAWRRRPSSTSCRPPGPRPTRSSSSSWPPTTRAGSTWPSTPPSTAVGPTSALAERMAANQRGEIVDLRNALARTQP